MSGGVTCSGGKLGIRLWIMLRDEINYQELCRGCKQQSGAACAQKRRRCEQSPAGWLGYSPSLTSGEFELLILIRHDRKGAWWTAPKRWSDGTERV